MSLIDDLRMQWRSGGALKRLLLLNVGVFVLLILGSVLAIPLLSDGRTAPGLRQRIASEWLAAPSDLRHLLLRPWTVVTYMFTHTGLGHIFWNLVLLWFAGRRFEDLLGGARLVGTYVLGGLFGLLLFIVAEQVGATPGVRLPTVMGASAGVMAVLVGIATYRPTMEVHLLLIGPVKLMYIAAVLVLLDLMGIGSHDGVAHAAHMGGALYGYLAAMGLKRGTDTSLGFTRGLERLAGVFRRRKPRMRVAHGSGRGRSDAQHNAAKRDQQARVDAILDKISRSGYDSLSKEEKDFLFKASK
jgi:membrane associated rhomboid family serine protease